MSQQLTMHILSLLSNKSSGKARARRTVSAIAPLLVSLSVWCAMGPGSIARAQTAPREVIALLAEIDAAASDRELRALMRFYDRNFINSDGLNRSSMQRVLKQLWESSPQLEYRTEIRSWQENGEELILETVTQITGVREMGGRQMNLNSTIRSRQRFADRKLVQQDILAERTQLTSGPNPPTVEMRLPEQVKVNQRYDLDVIVREPLGDDLLMGSLLEEPIRADNHFQPATADLELISAGGIFKQGVAPGLSDNRWVSAVFVRGGGMTMITQRLRIVP